MSIRKPGARPPRHRTGHPAGGVSGPPPKEVSPYCPTASGDGPPVVLSAFIWHVARWHARKLRIYGDDMDDCAVEFVEKVLRLDADPPDGIRLKARPAAWLEMTSQNHAINFKRKLRIRRSFEKVWPTTTGEDGETESADCTDPALSPEAAAFRREFWTRVGFAVERLTPTQRELFIRHHLMDQPIRDTAEGSGRSHHAVEQTLLRARVRLRSVLERQGLGETELRTYLAFTDRPLRPRLDAVENCSDDTSEKGILNENL